MSISFTIDLDKHGTAGVQALMHMSKLLEVHRDFAEADAAREAARSMREEGNARKVASQHEVQGGAST